MLLLPSRLTIHKKAAKQQASRNTSILNRAHLISLGINVFFIIVRLLLFRASTTQATVLLYIIFSSPTLVIEYTLEKIGRPQYAKAAELKKPGEDLDAKGLIEYAWDVLYWSWGCIVTAALFGNKAWWMWSVVPLYSAYLAFTTFGSMRQGMAGMAGQGDGAQVDGEATSNRQKKVEKRGGQKTRYR